MEILDGVPYQYGISVFGQEPIILSLVVQRVFIKN